GSQEIAPRVLSRELKALTVSGLIVRKDFGVVPPKVEYRLTRKGQSFIPVIESIRKWGERHLGPSNNSESALRIAAECQGAETAISPEIKRSLPRDSQDLERICAMRRTFR